MKDLDYQVGTREFAAIILLTVGVKLADTTPTIIIDKSGGAAWMVPWISMVLTGISFCFLLPLLKKHKDKGLVSIVNLTVGKYLGFFLNSVMFFIAFSATVVNSQSYVDIISGLFFKKTPTLVLIMSLVLTYYYVASRGFDTIGRVAWLVTPYIKTVLLIFPILIWQSLDFSFMYPIFGKGIGTIAKEGVNFSSVFADVIVLAVLFPQVKDFKTFRTVSLVTLVITTFEISFYLLVFVFAFGYPTIDRMNFPFQQLTRLATLGVGIQHIESLFLGFWIMASVVHFATYLYASTALFCYTFKMDDVEPMLLPFAGLVIILALFLPNVSTDLLIRKQTLVYSSYLILPLPVLLWGIDKVKGFVHK